MLRSVRHVQAVAVLLVAAALGSAAPPEVPAQLKAKPGQLVRIVVKGDAELGTLKNFADSEAFWGELVGPKGQRHFVFQAPADGKRAEYVIGWWTKGETEGVSTTVVIEGVAPVPPVPPPGPNPPVDPPTPPAGTYYFLVVRADGPADPAFTKAMSLPAWTQLRAKGHQFKDKTQSAAKADLGLELPPGTVLPCVVTLSTAGGVSKVVRGPVALPTTDAGVAALPEGVR